MVRVRVRGRVRSRVRVTSFWQVALVVLTVPLPLSLTSFWQVALVVRSVRLSICSRLSEEATSTW